jgi:hypothetical protein
MQKTTQQGTATTVNFLAEQDGPPERDLKRMLADTFARLGSVKAAYLARVDYGRPSEHHVALCIVTKRRSGVTERYRLITSAILAQVPRVLFTRL